MDELGPVMPPHIAARRERALRHEKDFLGVALEEAIVLAERLDITVQAVLPHHAVTADLSPCRVRLWLGRDGTVDRTSVG